MEEIKKEELSSSRRDLLKKAGKTAAFVVPTIVTFSIPSLQVSASTQSMKHDPFRVGPGAK